MSYSLTAGKRGGGGRRESPYSGALRQPFAAILDLCGLCFPLKYYLLRCVGYPILTVFDYLSALLAIGAGLALFDHPGVSFQLFCEGFLFLWSLCFPILRLAVFCS